MGAFVVVLILSVSTNIRQVRVQERAGDINVLEQKERKNGECMISSRGTDGVGHQMEAKLTCIATAAALGLSYVHFPIGFAEHGVNVDEFHAIETMFGLGERFPKFNNDTMILEKREPIHWVGHCDDASWFDEDTRPKTCPQGVVYLNDNCFDFFYCAPYMNKNYTEKMVKALQDLHVADGDSFASKKGNQSKSKYDDENRPLTIAVHIRQNDGIRIPLATYFAIIRRFRNVVPDAAVIIHSDGNLDRDKLPGHQKLPAHVVVRGKKTTSLIETLEELISADILVASYSSLSFTAGLANMGRPVVSLQPDFMKRAGRNEGRKKESRKGVENLPGWSVVYEREHPQELEFYESVVAEAIAWRKRQRER